MRLGTTRSELVYASNFRPDTMTDEATARLCFWLVHELEFTTAALSEVMELPERQVRELLDIGHSLALWDLNRQQTRKRCGTRIKQ